MNIYNDGTTKLTTGDIERMQKRIAELEREKAGLVAQVEQMKLIVAVHERELPNLLNKSNDDKLYLPLSVAMNSIVDAQELRKKEILQIQAEAGRAGYLQAIHDLGYRDSCLTDRATKYAERVKVGTL